MLDHDAAGRRMLAAAARIVATTRDSLHEQAASNGPVDARSLRPPRSARRTHAAALPDGHDAQAYLLERYRRVA